MSMVEIETALHQAYSDGGFGLETLYENFAEDPSNAGTWAAVHFMPNQPVPRGLGHEGDDAVTGIYQIDLNYPLNEGRKNIVAKAEEIRAYFWAGRKFSSGDSTVAIVSAGSSSGRRVNQNYRISVSIRWDARISRA